LEQILERRHLRSDIRVLLEGPIEERIIALEKDLYIPYGTADYILAQMERLMVRESINTVRPLGMLISSSSGNGKTTVLSTFASKYPYVVTPEVDIIPVIQMQAPPSPSEKRFLGEVLKAIGVPDYDKGTAETRLKRVGNYVDKCKAKMLLVDEIHNLLSGSPRQLEETCNLIKYLANALGLAIVLAGTERAENVIASDPQLKSRFPITKMAKWVDGQPYRAFLTLLESTIPLPKPSNLASEEKASFLLKESAGVLGHIIRSVKNAAYEAIMNGSHAITMEHLKRNSVNVPRVGPIYR
jgi:hypothetical protein